MKNKISTLCIIAISSLLFTGCAQQPEVGYENVGRFTRIDNDFTEKNQFQLDKDYCSGKSAQPFIPIYIPTTLSNTANNNYNISGTVQTYNYNRGTTTANFTGTATPYVSSGGSFTTGFANGYAMMSNSMARKAARERENKIFDDCMTYLGWEIISRETASFTKNYYKYHSEYYSEIKMPMLLGKFKENPASLSPSQDRKKIKEYLKQNQLQNKYDIIIKDLEEYISKNQDIEMTANALYFLAGIYRDALITEINHEKYMSLLIQSSNLGQVDAQYDLAMVYMNGVIEDHVTYNAYKDISLKSNEKAIYYLKKVAERYIPKDDENILLLGNGRLSTAERPFGLAMRYKNILKARHILGASYFLGNTIESNRELGLEYIKNAAERDLLEAKMDLALYYSDIYTARKENFDKAIYWLKRALSQHENELHNSNYYNLSDTRLYPDWARTSILSEIKAYIPAYELENNPKLKKFFDYYKIKQ